ncbi:MAG: helicase HerA domain-containing protein [Halobacteriaceae archaeon]
MQAEDSSEGATEQIRVGETVDGEAVTLPVVQVLTGRGFVTGKSGSGKSNTASVVVEELLEAGYPVLIVDTDGEYYGLKETYELLHAGADEECDIQVGPEHASRLATLALEQNVPIILDVSGYLDEDDADELVRETARHLFAREKKLKKPFLLVIEECHEYIPEGGGMGETGKMLVKVGKRGRKHGLGIVGISQRPADVKKDFITQANWLCWHRLTWENDTKVVGRIVGGEYGDLVSDLDAGEAFLQTDWTDREVRRVRFRRKRTFDAGATPGLDDFERPELKSVSESLMDDLQSITEQQRREEDRIEELEAELAEREERIAELEAELERARDVSAAARQMANALGDDGARAQARLPTETDEIRRLRDRVEELEARLETDEGADDSEAATGTDQTDGDDETDQTDGDVETDQTDGDGETDIIDADARARAAEADGSDGQAADAGPGAGARETSDGARTRDGDGGEDGSVAAERVLDLVQEPGVVTRVRAAYRESRCNEEHTWSVVARLATAGPLRLQEVADGVDTSTEAVQSLLAELRKRDLVVRDEDLRYRFDADHLRAVADDDRAHPDLRGQWEPE